MKIIFAQGNPGNQYMTTRHNIGFTFANMLAKKWGSDFTKKPKFHADIAEMTFGGEKVLLVKPTTFYNETGQSARLLIDFYKISATDDFLVIHDDLALPFGTIRTRQRGSDAGNNGVKSLNAHIGEQHKRIRVGIYNEHRDTINDVDFVLGSFTGDEKKEFPLIFDEVDHFVDGFLQDAFVLTKVRIDRSE
jgi:peptidyl-tRNA hydrolase, PTH1 family